jgi:four helix bundle suffix protein
MVVNALICLSHQANYLLDRQIQGLERQFIEEGDYSERLAAARLEKRRSQQGGSIRTDRTDGTVASASAPNCVVCGKAMVLRTARKGARYLHLRVTTLATGNRSIVLESLTEDYDLRHRYPLSQ